MKYGLCCRKLNSRECLFFGGNSQFNLAEAWRFRCGRYFKSSPTDRWPTVREVPLDFRFSDSSLVYLLSLSVTDILSVLDLKQYLHLYN